MTVTIIFLWSTNIDEIQKIQDWSSLQTFSGFQISPAAWQEWRCHWSWCSPRPLPSWYQQSFFKLYPNLNLKYWGFNSRDHKLGFILLCQTLSFFYHRLVRDFERKILIQDLYGMWSFMNNKKCLEVQKLGRQENVKMQGKCNYSLCWNWDKIDCPHKIRLLRFMMPIVDEKKWRSSQDHWVTQLVILSASLSA